MKQNEAKLVKSDSNLNKMNQNEAKLVKIMQNNSKLSKMNPK